jgi:hypothetical protein
MQTTLYKTIMSSFGHLAHAQQPAQTSQRKKGFNSTPYNSFFR